MTTLADGDQTRAGTRQPVEQSVRREHALGGRRVEHVAPGRIASRRTRTVDGDRRQACGQWDGELHRQVLVRVLSQRMPAPASASALHSRSDMGLVCFMPPVSAMKPVNE